MALRIASVVAGPVQEGGQETGLTLTLPSRTRTPAHSHTLRTGTGMGSSGDNADRHRYIQCIYIISTADHADPPLASVGQQWAAGAW